MDWEPNAIGAAKAREQGEACRQRTEPGPVATAAAATPPAAQHDARRRAGPATPELVGPDDPFRERRLPWAILLKRTWRFSVLVCPRCREIPPQIDPWGPGPMRLIAAIEDPCVAAKILAHLNPPARPPPRGRPWRAQRELALEHRADDHDAIDPPAFAE